MPKCSATETDRVGSRPSNWLTERYCLYTLDDQRRVQRGEIQHPLWPLQNAEATLAQNTMADEIGGVRLACHYQRACSAFVMVS